MAKIVRSFKGKAKAKAWIESCKQKYPGKITGGGVYAVNAAIYHAYVFGDITQEMYEALRPRTNVRIYDYTPNPEI